MFLLHASISLSFLLLLIHISSFLLTKLFTFLHHRAISKDQGDVQLDVLRHKKKLLPSAPDGHSEKNVADVLCREDLLFFNRESGVKDSLFTEQANDSNEQDSLELENTSVWESLYGSPLENLGHNKLGIEYGDDLITDVQTPSPCPSASSIIILASEDVACEDDRHEHETNQIREGKNFWEGETFSVVSSSHSDSRNFRLEEVHDGKENFGWSTSKSSIEWRSSTILRDSETEYPFSSSSRRSSSNWDSYAVLFHKYDEEMTFFDRISVQKLRETESLRSIKYQPRSISQRIVRKLFMKSNSSSRGVMDPYVELESAYVTQICLTWEALNWNYTNFCPANSDQDMKGYCFPSRIAQQLQQFEVLLQRFIENEPYEHGRRPEVYARVRSYSPKLLQVPEFKDSEADEGKEEMISTTEFLIILEHAIRTFMNFLKADKESYCQMLKSLIKKKLSSVDPTLLHLLKKANKKKKMRLKDLGRQRRCPKKKKIKEEEMEILMGLIDMKIVSRVLRMSDITEEQLHWCDEKMSKVIVWNGKIHRDSSPLFFPIH